MSQPRLRKLKRHQSLTSTRSEIDSLCSYKITSRLSRSPSNLSIRSDCNVTNLNRSKTKLTGMQSFGSRLRNSMDNLRKFFTRSSSLNKREEYEAIEIADEVQITMNAANMTKSVEIAGVTLNDGVNAEGSLYRLQKGLNLRLVPGPSLPGKEIVLYTNFPIDEKVEFVRTQYCNLIWHSKTGEKLTTHAHPYVRVIDVDIYCEIELNRSGTFHFYFCHKDSVDTKPNGALYIQVEPILHVGPPGAQKIIPLDSIRCQTFLAKCLGPINTWESKLRVAKESGYNVAHLTPIQELGGSRSCYSVRNQLKLNHEFAAATLPASPQTKAASPMRTTFEDVEKALNKCRHEWGMASICDIVLNHTANESDWLKEHPESTYSCNTMPHLRPAFLLDATLAQCGRDVQASVLEQFGVPRIIENEDHLQSLKYQLHTNYLSKINIFELYQCNVTAYVNKLSMRLLEFVGSYTSPATSVTTPILSNPSQQASPVLGADAITPASLQLLQQLQAVGLQQQLLQGIGAQTATDTEV